MRVPLLVLFLMVVIGICAVLAALGLWWRP